MLRILFILMVFSSSLHLRAQESVPLRISYLSHFGVNKGIQLQALIPAQILRNINKFESHLTPRISYFVLPDIQNNLQIGIDLEYTNAKNQKGLYSMLSVGVGYVLSFVRYDGRLHLGTGEIENNVKAAHSLLPQITTGVGWNTIKRKAIFLKLFFGRQISMHNSDATVIGGEVGIQIMLKT